MKNIALYILIILLLWLAYTNYVQYKKATIKNQVTTISANELIEKMSDALADGKQTIII